MGQSKITGAAGEGALPDLVPLGVEDEFGIGGSGEPVAPGDFAVELAGAPAGITDREQVFLGALLMADVAQDLPAGGHREGLIDAQRLGPAVFGAMHDKAAFGLHRAAEKYRDRAIELLVGGIGPAIAVSKQRRDRLLGDPAVDDKAECAARIMLQQQNDAVMKARVLHRRRG